ncbi:MAG: class I SAM-dependent methyltransferase [Pseudomonadota bacterium]
MEFTPFDVRHYPTLAVSEGYDEWAATYDAVVQDEMDLRLLGRLSKVDWTTAGRAIDLACGTGRIGQWLRERGVRAIDGLDFTPAMMAQARARQVYERLHEADVRETGQPAASYDLAIQVLADEHLPDLEPLYRETARITRSGGTFVLAGYHSHFLMNGIPTHFDREDGQPVAVESYVHLFSDHVKAAHRNSWCLIELEEGVVDETWIAKKPKWIKYQHHPVSFAAVWRRS